ncbi:MAG: tRNA (N6-threonylcarbamoyladenosine(37)-N6)-methyltransferase TrmO, partial [Eubacterium sp.]|nr:tRNA (N6-threonylcarbamoyladenosine(37)-N6)-methyltransferase TrmO [Eubacterium sp.]
FGIPRQAGLVEELESYIVFEDDYKNPDALRGIEGFDYIWVLWIFSENQRDKYSPTVRPPRLGGNERVGVFATRSPFRPNNIGLSCLKLEGIDQVDGRLALKVRGGDLMDGTPILDIKPYIPYTDAHPGVRGGFSEEHRDYELEVQVSEELLEKVREDKREALLGLLAQDPRPAYKKEGQTTYGLSFAGYEVKFLVEEGVLKVVQIS